MELDEKLESLLETVIKASMEPIADLVIAIGTPSAEARNTSYLDFYFAIKKHTPWLGASTRLDIAYMMERAFSKEMKRALQQLEEAAVLLKQQE